MNFRPIQPRPDQPIDDNNDGDKRTTRSRISTACEACRKAKSKCDGTRPRCLVCTSKHRSCVFRGEEGQSEKSILIDRIREGESREAALNAQIELLQQRIQELQAGQTIDVEPAKPDEPATQASAIQKAPNPIELAIPSASLTSRAIDGFFSCSGKLFHVFSQVQVSRMADSVFGERDSKGEDRKADIASLMAVAAVGSQYSNTSMDDKVQETFYSVAKIYLDAVITRRPLEGVKVCTLLCMYNVFGKATVSLAYADAGLGMCDRFGLHCPRRQIDGIEDAAWIDYRKAWRTLIFLSTWLSATLGYRTGNDQSLRRMITLSELHIDDQVGISEVVQTEMTKIAVLKARILHMHLACKYLTPDALNSMIRDLQDWYDRLPQQMQLQHLSGQELSHEVRRSIYHVHLLYLGAHMLLFRRIVAENTQNLGREPPKLWHPSSELLSRQCPSAVIAASMSARIFKLLLDENGIFQRCWLIIFQSYTSCIIIMHNVLTKLVSLKIRSYEDELKNTRLCLETLTYCGAADPVASLFLDKAQGIYNSLINHIEKLTEILRESHQEPVDTVDSSAGRGTTDNPTGRTLQDDNTRASDDGPEFLSASYQRSVEDLSYDLLELLCRPFGDPSHREGSKESLAATQKLDPSRYEHPVLLERLEWDFEDSAPFRWNSEVLGLGNIDTGTSQGGEGSVQNTRAMNRFLDSTHPSGWA
ncbi:hypothetical protein F5B22DRAFT_614851 [Xylaria bambusicola]|uniref:uncharacterized protein n=1 Tax=Xylaria bambusicola TaxID=326684 RepID=UPI002008E70F|nr:uncharacterized protein F5B22DRAFT_614851 [Xylaria bambusicola]KAI0512683.1 hypothetical protein F5B22DRAFT_614851 [Xylaria bambusicola]